MGPASIAALIGMIASAAAATVGTVEEVGHNIYLKDEEELQKKNFKNSLLTNLRNSGISEDSDLYKYVASQSSSSLYNIATTNGLVGTSKSFLGFGGDYYTDPYWDDITALFEELSDISTEYPEQVSFSDVDAKVSSEVDALYKELEESLNEDEARQTQLFKDQLAENNAAFNDYREQILRTQHLQNAQLINSVDNAMARTRRNALEAGASAGLRLAENINTTIALQNKQSQTSLETSNQLAQQLLNQRQAAAGIRSGYSDMLSKNNATRRQYAVDKDNAYANKLQIAWDSQRQKNQDNIDKYDRQFDKMNPYSNSYSTYIYNKSKSQYN